MPPQQGGGKLDTILIHQTLVTATIVARVLMQKMAIRNLPLLTMPTSLSRFLRLRHSQRYKLSDANVKKGLVFRI